MHGNREIFAELRRVSNIFVEDCLRKQFCAILEIHGGYTKNFNFVNFVAFSVLSTDGLAEIAVFSKNFARKNQFLKYQKNYVYKKWKFRPGIEIKNFQVAKMFRKEVYLGSTWNHSAPKSADRAEIVKNRFLRQSST